MTSMTHNAPQITGGVDTHGLTHHAAVIDSIGRHLADQEFPATIRGYRDLLDWTRSHGDLVAVGVEGTGAYGAELTRVLTAAGVAVVDVDRPDRTTRRMKGKSDPIDAYAAATAVLSGRATGIPKNRDGAVEAVRALRIARRSAVKARTQAMNQIRGLLVSAPAILREQTTGLDRAALIRTLARLRPGDDLSHPLAATRAALRRLARRHQTLDTEITELDAELGPLTRQAAPTLLELFGVGPETAGQLLTSAGDNPGTHALRSSVRAPDRDRTDPRVLRPHPPPPPQPRRRPRRQQRPAHHRPGPHAPRRTHPRLRPTPYQGRTLEERDHALPQTIRRPRGLPRPDHHTSHPKRPCTRRLTSIGASVHFDRAGEQSVRFSSRVVMMPRCRVRRAPPRRPAPTRGACRGRWRTPR
ncbi:transposase [Saccharopolyspora spinosa]|uniref:Transposase n=1 Tax=Saccharopolyspora spinosa TaxID=60894 RepID=A0A2N3Y3U9_SACSN|nr:transposase [Saccharopolyspora spinosa]